MEKHLILYLIQMTGLTHIYKNIHYLPLKNVDAVNDYNICNISCTTLNKEFTATHFMITVMYLTKLIFTLKAVTV